VAAGAMRARLQEVSADYERARLEASEMTESALKLWKENRRLRDALEAVLRDPLDRATVNRAGALLGWRPDEIPVKP
jgi:hypothetical protein